MIHDGIVATCHSETVKSLVLLLGRRSCLCSCIATIRADETYDAVRGKAERSTTEGYALARSCLACNGNVWIRTGETTFERNISADIKDYGSRTANLCYSIAECAFRWIVDIIVEGCDVIDYAATTTYCEASIALCTRECEMTRTERPSVTVECASVGILFHYLPVVCVEGRK